VASKSGPIQYVQYITTTNTGTFFPVASAQCTRAALRPSCTALLHTVAHNCTALVHRVRLHYCIELPCALRRLTARPPLPALWVNICPAEAASTQSLPTHFPVASFLPKLPKNWQRGGEKAPKSRLHHRREATLWPQWPQWPH